MGKIISKNKREENEDEQEIRKYEQQTTDNPYGFGLQGKTLKINSRFGYPVSSVS